MCAVPVVVVRTIISASPMERLHVSDSPVEVRVNPTGQAIHCVAGRYPTALRRHVKTRVTDCNCNSRTRQAKLGWVPGPVHVDDVRSLLVVKRCRVVGLDPLDEVLL